ncbi:hypothetical protein RUM44_009167 [Polyplax serrata]|uniref:Uncharacterized protein n=1 Tax=Polyplax serrata TaxID=468196 RepID=A0ABR1ASK1_POLSC
MNLLLSALSTVYNCWSLLKESELPTRIYSPLLRRSKLILIGFVKKNVQRRSHNLQEIRGPCQEKKSQPASGPVDDDASLTTGMVSGKERPNVLYISEKNLEKVKVRGVETDTKLILVEVTFGERSKVKRPMKGQIEQKEFLSNKVLSYAKMNLRIMS